MIYERISVTINTDPVFGDVKFTLKAILGIDFSIGQLAHALQFCPYEDKRCLLLITFYSLLSSYSKKEAPAGPPKC